MPPQVVGGAWAAGSAGGPPATELEDAALRRRAAGVPSGWLTTGATGLFHEVVEEGVVGVEQRALETDEDQEARQREQPVEP